MFKSVELSLWMPLFLLIVFDYCVFYFIFLTFIYFWDREKQSMNGGGSERGRHRIWSRFQALSCQHRAWCGARTHQLPDHDLSWSRMLNRRSHPGILTYWPFWISYVKTVDMSDCFVQGTPFIYAFPPLLSHVHEALTEVRRNWELNRKKI